MGATTPARRYLVITTQRTGSSWLMDLINGVSGAEGHMELFYNDIRREPPRAGCNDYPRFIETRYEFGSGRRPGAVFDYLDRLYSRPGAVGFKLMYSQLQDYPELLLYIIRRKLALVHLVRKNYLDVVLSEQLARTTNRYHATKRENYDRPSVLHLDPPATVARVRLMARKHRLMRYLLRILPNPVHEIAYEDLCRDDGSFERLCAFIGVDAAQRERSESGLVKLQRSPYSEVIENFPEIESALAGAGYQHLLHSH